MSHASRGQRIASISTPSFIVAIFGMVVTSLMGNAPGTDPVANEWPQWRGPNRDGMVLAGPRLANAFSPSGPKLLWKTSYGDAMQAKNGGSCTPVVAGGKVILYLNPRPFTPKKLITLEYLTRWGWDGDLPANVATRLEESGLTCFDAQTGAELWKSNAMGGRYDWGNTVMPWTKERTTYVIGGNGKCVNLETGKTVWTAPKMTQSCVSPTICGDSAVFFGEKLQMYQLSPTAAVQSWAIAGRSGDRVSGPIFYQDAVYTSAMGGTRCVDRKSGQVRWEEPQLHQLDCVACYDLAAH